MDTLFHILEEATVILRTGGRYQQADVYQRRGLLYAATSRCVFVRLGERGFTSHPSTSWEDLVLPDGHGYTRKDTGGLSLTGELK